MPIWRSVLLVCREIDVRIGKRRRERFQHAATDQEVADAVEAFRAFPKLAAQLTDGAAQVAAEVVELVDPLRSVTREGDDSYWPSPDDTRAALDEFAPAGAFESIFVFWPQRDSAQGRSIPCRGWGLGMGASDWTNGATYAVVANAPTWQWTREAPGEVWLHEWLHGVCHHFAQRGYVMPERDADGGGLHRYERDETQGWTGYYRDLMSGNVAEGSARRGIPLSAWSERAS